MEKRMKMREVVIEATRIARDCNISFIKAVQEIQTYEGKTSSLTSEDFEVIKTGCNSDGRMFITVDEIINIMLFKGGEKSAQDNKY